RRSGGRQVHAVPPAGQRVAREALADRTARDPLQEAQRRRTASGEVISDEEVAGRAVQGHRPRRGPGEPGCRVLIDLQVEVRRSDVDGSLPGEIEVVAAA